ncbi:MAG: hypothetical protein GY811_22385, partial [Myxococcales bacterium]|nr:hypothetical protein [Myxococcales bacterium]
MNLIAVSDRQEDGKLILLSLVPLVAAACTSPDTLYCDDDTPCTDPDRPFCDLTGEELAANG